MSAPGIFAFPSCVEFCILLRDEKTDAKVAAELSVEDWLSCGALRVAPLVGGDMTEMLILNPCVSDVQCEAIDVPVC
jgi:hypothetical protein